MAAGPAENVAVCEVGVAKRKEKPGSWPDGLQASKWRGLWGSPRLHPVVRGISAAPLDHDEIDFILVCGLPCTSCIWSRPTAASLACIGGSLGRSFTSSETWETL